MKLTDLLKEGEHTRKEIMLETGLSKSKFNKKVGWLRKQGLEVSVEQSNGIYSLTIPKKKLPYEAPKLTYKGRNSLYEVGDYLDKKITESIEKAKTAEFWIDRVRDEGMSRAGKAGYSRFFKNIGLSDPESCYCFTWLQSRCSCLR